MFTGIVEQIGIVTAVSKTQAEMCLKVKIDTIDLGIKLGDSIAINGVCLSVVNIERDILGFDVIHETIKKTTLAGLKVNDFVNLERSLKADSRIGGHFVSGHIDYKAKLEEIKKDSNGVAFKVSLPVEFSKFVAEKGSIALDGVSLTVAEVDSQSFTVYLIPHTVKVTTFGKKQKGDFVNVETDLLAKYITKQTQKPNIETLLKQYGYI